MTFRPRQITGFRTDNEASNRFQEHLKEVLNPVLKSFGASLTWIIVGDPGAPPFQNGWKHFGAGNNPVSFSKDTFGIVRLRGTATGGTAPPSTIFTLPDGYRPKMFLNVPIAANGAFGYVLIGATGIVNLQGGSTAWASLENIAFEAEQ